MTDEPGMLIVEDNPDDLALLRRALRKAEVTINYAVAGDGDDAIAQLERVSAQNIGLRVILLDLKLPRRSGFEVLAWLRAHERLKRVPVVVLTSSAINSDLQRAYDLGANSYLVKPADPGALVAMVGRIDHYWLQTNRISA